MKHHIAAIVATDQRGAIGAGGNLLCHMPADMKHFREMTMGHSIVMGRKTFESFPKRPLPGRQNIVITRKRSYRPEGATVAHSIKSAIKFANMEGDVFIIGGEQIYRQAFDLVETLYLTIIHHTFDNADTFFPAIVHDEWEETSHADFPADEKNPYPFSFITLKRVTSKG